MLVHVQSRIWQETLCGMSHRYLGGELRSAVQVELVGLDQTGRDALADHDGLPVPRLDRFLSEVLWELSDDPFREHVRHLKDFVVDLIIGGNIASPI